MSWMRKLLTMVACLGLSFLARPDAAQAQASFDFVNSTDSTANFINETSAPCTNRFTRTFNVSNSFSVADVNIGVLLAHTYRGDLLMWLVSPSGTRIQLTSGSGGGASNYNVLFDDAAASGIANYTANATATASTVVPPYASAFRPSAALSAFNGQNSAGVWTLEICDQFGGDSGTFYQANLTLTSALTNYADLSLTKTVSNSAPTAGATISYTLQARNASASPNTATGVLVTDVLPLGANYVSHSGSGTYNPATGVWQVGSLAPGGVASLTITITVNATAGATIVNTAEITASSHTDIDSTPGNGATGEDDYATASFTVSGARTAGIAPTLFCTAGSRVFDWDSRSWAAGSTNNSYSFSTLGQIGFALANPGVWLNNASVGGQSPVLQNIVTGGLATPQLSLMELVDLPNQAAVATTTITLPRSVMSAQFTVFDVDFGAGQFADRIIVTGQYRGNTVMPVLTNGVANYVIGNAAFGDGVSDNASANGNLVVTFQQPVDTIIIQYGNHAAAPADPGQQGIALHDISVCMPTTSLTATKVSAVFSDPVNGETNAKAIPGSVIDYTISVSNAGAVATDTGQVSIVDQVPPQTKFCLADMSPGAGPLLFQNSVGTSGLTYSYAGLGNTGDSLSFSSDGGATYSYTPVPDADGCDTNITHFRVIPSGAFAEGTTVTLRARFVVE